VGDKYLLSDHLTTKGVEKISWLIFGKQNILASTQTKIKSDSRYEKNTIKIFGYSWCIITIKNLPIYFLKAAFTSDFYHEQIYCVQNKYTCINGTRICFTYTYKMDHKWHAMQKTY